jgi:hypothetical protein
LPAKHRFTPRSGVLVGWQHRGQQGNTPRR